MTQLELLEKNIRTRSLQGKEPLTKEALGDIDFVISKLDYANSRDSIGHVKVCFQALLLAYRESREQVQRLRKSLQLTIPMAQEMHRIRQITEAMND